MRIPLQYQLSEYDCAPTSILNGISWLFQREQIPAELIRSVLHFSLDQNDSSLRSRMGTSRSAVMYLCKWINKFGEQSRLPVASTYHMGAEIYIGEGSILNYAVENGGAAIVRLFLEDWHYVLLTRIAQGYVYAFDPYFMEEKISEELRVDLAHPFEYNRIISAACMNRARRDDYALGEVSAREAIILYDKSRRN